MPRFSKKAKRHAAESSMRTRRMVKEASGRSGPVTVSYLPGFEPPLEHRLAMEPKTRFPFKATINGEEVIVWDDWIEYPEDVSLDEF